MEEATQLTSDERFAIRYTGLDDLPHLLRWLAREEIARFFPIVSNKEREFYARNWIQNCRQKSSLTAVYDGKVIGIVTIFIALYKKVAHMSQIYLVVDPDVDYETVGYELLKNIIHLGKNYFHLEMLQVETYGNAPIHRLLEKFGFRLVFEQEGYMKKGEEYLPRKMFEVELS